jgi:nucleoside-diphosphate-sugar epimerase
MNILIIGGTRFIGPSVVKKLYKQRHDITLFHRGKSKADLPGDIPHIYGDRNSLKDFCDEFAKLKPELVLDMAPVIEKHAKDIVEVFKGIAERVVAISSQDVYQAYGLLLGIEKGDLQPTPTDEDAALRTKLYPYRQDKLRADDDPRKILDDYEKILIERVVMKEKDLSGTVLRLPMVYGPLDYQHRLYSYAKRMNDKRPAIIMEKSMADWRSSVGYVEDVAHAIVLAINDDRAKNRIYNVAEVDNLNQAEWVEKIGKVFGWDGEVVVLPKEKLPEKMHADFRTEQDLTVDTSRIRNELGYKEMTPARDAIKATIEWELENPPANIDPEDYDYRTEDEILGKVSG